LIFLILSTFIFCLIPFTIFFYFYSIKRSGGKSIKFANFDAIARIKGVDIYSRNINIFLLDLLIILLVVFSLAGSNLYIDKQSSSYSYLIAIDSSESMGASDLVSNRFEVAKDTAVGFINALPIGTNVAIVSFAENAILEQDLTVNKPDLVNAIRKITLTSVGGTDVFEVISLSHFILKSEQNRAIILLSDGQVNVGNFNSSIDNAVKDHILVYALGLGTTQGGKTDLGISVIDENSLKSIAERTNGKYFKVTSLEEMKGAFDSIIKISNRPVKISLQLYLLIAAVLVFILREFVFYFNKLAI